MSQTRTLLALFALAAAVFAQNSTSTLDGFVKDPQGALIPNCNVVVTNAATLQQIAVVTDDHGHWAVPSLPGGTYSVTVVTPGFKKASIADVKMDAGIPATVSITLEVGAVTDTIDVTGGAEVLQTSSATVTTNLIASR
jgi:hypothetical protein